MFYITDTNDVLDKWRNSFSELYNPVIHAHREDILDQYNMSDFIQSYPCNFDEPLTLTEFRNAISKAKSGKATCLDMIPMEVLKNESMVICLCKLYNTCYTNGNVPSCWSKALINPIPKSSTTDPRNPLQYRGITLAASMYKIYYHLVHHQ